MSVSAGSRMSRPSLHSRHPVQSRWCTPEHSSRLGAQISGSGVKPYLFKVKQLCSHVRLASIVSNTAHTPSALFATIPSNRRAAASQRPLSCTAYLKAWTFGVLGFSIIAKPLESTKASTIACANMERGEVKLRHVSHHLVPDIGSFCSTSGRRGRTPTVSGTGAYCLQ